MDFLYQWCPVQKEEGKRLHKRIEEIWIHAISEAVGNDDTLIQQSRIPFLDKQT